MAGLRELEPPHFFAVRDLKVERERDTERERERARERERIPNHKNVKGGIPPTSDWGVAYVIIPLIVKSYKHFDKSLQIFSQYQRIWLQKLLIFIMILEKFWQEFLPKDKVLVSQAKISVFLLIVCSKFVPKKITKLRDYSCKNTKFSSWGGTFPVRAPITPLPPC